MRLSRYLASMTIFLLAVAGVAAWLIVRLESAFLANPLLNAVLIAVWLIGIIYIFVQTLRLSPEIRWVREVQRSRQAVIELDPPPLMGSLARLMEGRKTPLMLTPTALRAVLDGIAVRLDESREIARYFIGLMIFLGLLGTFWGLLQTVGSVGAVVNGLSVTADPTELFTTLKAGLQGPLVGMGTAFGSSLLGLAGSLVLGFLDLQMGQAQNRFFVDLENWLFASAGDRGTSDESSPLPEIQALVEKTAGNIDQFRQIMAETEYGRQEITLALQALADRIEGLVVAQQDAQRIAHAMLTQRVETDATLVGLLNKVDQALDAGELGGGEAVRAHLKAIEAGINRVAEEQSQSRVEALEEARNEIKRLARTIGIFADEQSGA
ncbi:MAG: conserved rane protein of unknown function [Rhodospirillales bacterium]|nr:conserved rane protein of unknown function [Rhodospirillales bacterium]